MIVEEKICQAVEDLSDRLVVLFVAECIRQCGVIQIDLGYEQCKPK